ncbi:MAG TPA: hypothetical protein VK454_09930, partial [Myxococcaceae bacterium]|nr:hypothetical protein [Myxococcaceae bacterium]
MPVFESGLRRDVREFVAEERSVVRSSRACLPLTIAIRHESDVLELIATAVRIPVPQLENHPFLATGAKASKRVTSRALANEGVIIADRGQELAAGAKRGMRSDHRSGEVGVGLQVREGVVE